MLLVLNFALPLAAFGAQKGTAAIQTDPVPTSTFSTTRNTKQTNAGNLAPDPFAHPDVISGPSATGVAPAQSTKNHAAIPSDSPPVQKPDLVRAPATAKSPASVPATEASAGSTLGGARLGATSLGQGITRPSVEIFQQARFSLELGAVQAAGGATQVADAAKELEANPAANVDAQLDRGFANIAQGNAAIEMGRTLYGQAKKVSADEAKLASVRGRALPASLPPLELDPGKLGEKSKSVLDEYEAKTGLNKDDLVKEINSGGSPYDVFAMIKNFPVGSGELREVSESASQKLGSSGYVQVTGSYSLADLVSEQNLKTTEFAFGEAPPVAMGEAKFKESNISGGSAARDVATVAKAPDELKRALAEEREAFLSAEGTDIFRPQAAAEDPENSLSLFERVRGKLKLFSKKL